MKRELIHLENVVKKFGDLTVLDEIDLTIYENEFVTLLGPSGCGKTTLLRIIAGIMQASSGEVLVDSMNYKDNEIDIKKEISFLSGNTKSLG